jgi:cytochrome bd ubiquinol oxidase subunit II
VRRAIGAGAAVFLAGLLVAALSSREAPLVFQGLTRRGFTLPLHAGTGIAAIVAFRALFRRRVRLARAAAAVQVALIVAGWGASQYPYLVAPDLTLASAAAPRATQVALLWALAAGALLLFPALYLLFRIFKGERPFAVVDRTRPR